jgi:hypothetical protein
MIIVWIYGKRLMYRYDISRVAHYTIDMVSDLYDGYALNYALDMV